MTTIPQLKTFAVSLSSTGVAEIAFNRPERYNSLSPLAYEEWREAIRWAAKCEDVKVTVLTGRGKYYTSGQELSIPEMTPEALEAYIKRSEVTKTLTDELINFPKILIAAVNGKWHAIGYGVTTLALCDVVYSVPDATFTTPFMKLSFCAEACSSVTFPRILGTSKANEMLLMGRTFTAKELEQAGLISRTFPTENFNEQVMKLAEKTAEFSVNAMKITKELVRSVDRELLLSTNVVEMERLQECMMSSDSIESMMRFFEESQKKKKAKAAAAKNKASKL
ncbi:ClpP/crotonase-like domain-containing protein [Phycomyces nitens]|nr:ClpP/crotonase-like domain-containing protein [Phycomyces nitens]